MHHCSCLCFLSQFVLPLFFSVYMFKNIKHNMLPVLSDVVSYDKQFILCSSPGLSSVVDSFPFLILSLFYHPHLLFPRSFQFLWLGFIKNLFVFCIYSALSNLLCETPPLSGSKMKPWAHSAFCWDINQMESLVFSEIVKDNFRPRGFSFFFCTRFLFS